MNSANPSDLSNHLALSRPLGSEAPTITQGLSTVKIPVSSCSKCGGRQHFDTIEWQFGRIWIGIVKCTSCDHKLWVMP